MTQDEAVGLFLAYVWSKKGHLSGKHYLFTGTVAEADELRAAAKVLGAQVNQTTPAVNTRKLTISWVGMNQKQNRNVWPYGKTPLQGLSFLIRGDVPARAKAFMGVGLEMQSEDFALALWTVAATVTSSESTTFSDT
jgi:hypothetical protein